MLSAIERRERILEILSDRRETTREALAAELGVAPRTIDRDILQLTSSAPIETVCGRYGGGIRVADGWYLSRRYLHTEQEDLLRELMSGLQPDQQKIMGDILSAFAKPKAKEKKH